MFEDISTLTKKNGKSGLRNKLDILRFKTNSWKVMPFGHAAIKSPLCPWPETRISTDEV